MRYKRVFLIKPSYGRSFYGAFHPPVGLGYIAENLAHNDIEYDMVDMGFNYRIEERFTKDRGIRAGSFRRYHDVFYVFKNPRTISGNQTSLPPHSCCHRRCAWILLS